MSLTQEVNEHGCVHLRQDDRRVISGHASLALELMEQVPEADVVLVGCGGGGLAAAVAAAYAHFGGDRVRNEVKVYGVEPEGANSMFLSLKVRWGASLVEIRVLCSTGNYLSGNIFKEKRLEKNAIRLNCSNKGNSIKSIDKFEKLHTLLLQYTFCRLP